MHLHLIDPGDVELHRVLGRHDVGLRGVELPDGGVQRVGLAAAGGARDEDHPPRLEDGLLELLDGLLLEPQFGEVEHEVVLVEEPHDDLLAEEGGEDRDAEVDLLGALLQFHLQFDAAVLREALLGDVELGEDLDARDDGVAQFHRGGHHLVEDAVHPEPDPELLLIGLDVDVGGLALDGVGEDEVDQPDDGGLLGLRLQFGHVHGLIVLQHLHRGVLRRGQVVHDLFQLHGVVGAEVFVEGADDGHVGGHHGLDVVAGEELEVVEGEDVGGVGHGHGQGGPEFGYGDDLVFTAVFRRDELDDVVVNLQVVEVHGGDGVLLGKDLGDVLLGDMPQFDQVLSDLPSRLFLLFEGFVQLFLGNEFRLEEQVANLWWHTPLI